LQDEDMNNVSDRPVVVDMTTTADAVWWAADYARRGGFPLRLVHDLRDLLSSGDPVTAVHPDVEVHREFTGGPVVDVLVTESETAHLVVVAHRRRSVLADLIDTPTVMAVSARASCPVVAVPPGVRVFDRHLPVVVGVHDDDHVPDLLALAFTEAERLGTSVTVVRCASRSDDIRSDGVRSAVAGAADRCPGVRVRTELITGSPARGLAWHARFSSAVVVGSRGGPRSAALSVLRHCAIPVFVRGSHVLVPDRPAPTFDVS
jgi:hypothetical protein